MNEFTSGEMRRADDPASGQAPTAVVIENDAGTRRLLSHLLASGGFVVATADNGLDGIELVREHRPHLTTTGLELPGIDGIETVRRVRALSPTYIVLVMASFHESDAILALAAGADDCVTTPLRLLEFRARVKAMLRRPRALVVPSGAPAAASGLDVATTRSLTHRDLTLDPLARTVRRGRDEIALTRTEFDLLETLLESARRPRSKAELAYVVRGDEPAGGLASDHDKRAIEVHMANLRRKLGDTVARPRYIETVRGLGYRLSPDGAS